MSLLRALSWSWFPLLVACGSSGSGGSAADAGLGGTAGSSGNDASLGGSGGGSAGSTAGAGGSAGVAGSVGPGGVGGAGGALDAGLNLGPEDVACAALDSASECISCCSDAHASWETVAPVTRACVCESPGTCSSQCAIGYCEGQSGSPACYDCIFPTLAPDGACYAPSKASCGADSDCSIYVDCRANCVLSHPGP